jgi:capsular polysaccharide biosynthesis protein
MSIYREKTAVNESPEASRDLYVLSLRGVLQVFRKRLWLVTLISGVTTALIVGFSLMQTPMYESSMKVLIGQQSGSSTPGSLGGDVQGLQQLTQTMAEGVNSRPIAEATIQQLDLDITAEDFLEKRLSVRQIAATQYIEVKYRDSSPERAKLVADTIGAVFSERVSEVSPSTNSITATVWERAEVENEPVSPNIPLNAGLALAVGAMLGMGLALLLEYLDDSWRSPEEAEQISGVPTFGVVPEFGASEVPVKD